MKNNTFFKLFIIFIVGFLFRVWFLDKPEGLWNDEYVGWFIASQDNWNSFITKLLENCHTPFYYIYLKVWMMLFCDTDISLRISSVIPSLLSIPIMYFIGKTLNDKKTGYMASIITAISSFNIYFAQEVRLYSLLFLFSALMILFFIKISNSIKNNNSLLKNFNFYMFFLFNALICFTHTLGIIFSAISIFTLIYFYCKEKQNIDIKKIIITSIPFLIVILITIPILTNIAFSRNLSQFWSPFSLSKIVFTLTDYFSPIQTNMSNSPDRILPYIFLKHKLNFNFIFFAIIPTIIALFSIIKSILTRNKVLNLLLLSSFLYFLFLILLSFIGKMVLSTKYSVEMYPVLIIAISIGLLSINNVKIKQMIIISFIGINLFYLLTSPTSASKLTRQEGHLAVVKLLENSRLKPTDKVILTYYDVDKFQRYLTDDDKYNFISINKFNFNNVMFNNNNYFETINNGKILYKDYFNEFPNQKLVDNIKYTYLNDIKKGEKVGLIVLDNVSFLSNSNIQEIISSEKDYKRTPFIFLVFSTLKNNIMYAFKDEYNVDSITQAGSWSLYVYEKKN